MGAIPLTATLRVRAFRPIGPERLDLLRVVANQLVKFRLVIMVIGQCGINLCNRQVRILHVHFFRRRSMRELVQNNLKHFHVCIIDPGDPLVIESDVAFLNGRSHFNMWRYCTWLRNSSEMSGWMVL